MEYFSFSLLTSRKLGILTLIYLLSWLDRTNIGNARVAGLQEDLHLSNTQYSISLTVTLIPFLSAEIPVNLILKIVGPDILLPSLLTAWGAVTTLQGIVHNYAGLLACRFFIGLLEGGLLPGIVLYLSRFYPRARLQRRLSVIFSAASLAGAFSGLLAAAIMKMDGIGNRPGWAWIFILEGLFSTIVGAISFILVPRSPTHCALLSDVQKDYVMHCLQEDGAISEDESKDAFSWKEVGKAFRSPHVWILTVLSVFNGIILYSLSYFAPSIVLGLVHNPTRAQLLSVPPYAAAFVVLNLASYLADKHHCRGLVVTLCSILLTTDFAMYLGSHNVAVQYGSLFLTVTGISTIAPAYTTWTANNTAPQIRRAAAIGMVCTTTNLGGILSTWLLGSLSAPPRYTTATIVLLICSVCLGICAIVNIGQLWRENQKKAEMRRHLTKEEEPEGLGDRSAWFIYIL